MNILCVGMNHKTAPVELRERFAVSTQELQELLVKVRHIMGLNEAVILSTCNRVEIYAATICPALSQEGIGKIFSNRANTEARLYFHPTVPSVRHLFRVASGLDSMVLGETEVFHQVKRAYAEASEFGSTARHLNKLFQQAFRVAKTVRSETNITRGPTSVGATAVALAEKIFGNLDGRKVMILGAGETSARTARSLVSRGVQSVIVSNRTYERAACLAAEIGGMALHFDHWQDFFPEVDILISSTGAPHAILTQQKLAALMPARRQRPLFIIDLAVPRDAEPSINELEGVFLYDIDSLEAIAHQSVEGRHQELDRCEALIEKQVLHFISWLRKSTW